MKLMIKLLPAPAVRFFRENWEWLVSWLVVAVSITLLIKFWPQGPSPVPPSIITQANFSVIYPKGYSIDPQSWRYVSGEKSVQFSATKDKYAVVFTEQKTPLEYQDDTAAYNRFIGSLRPRANFDVPLGTVSIANFVTKGDYQVVGETGILNAKGTFVLAHPDTQISDDQWRNLFESLAAD